MNNRVHQLRVVVTAEDYDDALHFYRDVLGLPELEVFASQGGRVTLLEAGRATLELADPRQAEFIDEVEVGAGSPGMSVSRSKWATRRPWRPSSPRRARTCLPSRRERPGTPSTRVSRHPRACS
jgi:catechol 2,3-dioxygenase-like lactoylglutathione lyase family enzyme